jgi:hypothetical protein
VSSKPTPKNKVLQKLRLEPSHINSSNSRARINISLIASLTAFVFTLLRGIENLGVPDGGDYYQQATEMTKGLGYFFDHPQNFTHGIGFSFLIRVTFLFGFGESLLVFKFLLAIVHGLSTYTLVRICQGLGFKSRFVLAAAILFLLDPFLLYTATNVQTESLVTLLVLYWGFLVISDLNGLYFGRFHIIFFAVSGFIAITMRPNSILPFAMIALLLSFEWKKQGINKKFYIGHNFLFLFLLLGYTIFVSALYNQFVFLATYGGLGFAYLCQPEFIPQYLGYASNSLNTSINDWVVIEDPIGAEIRSRYPDMNLGDLNRAYYWEGLVKCAQSPIVGIGLVLLKILALWRPFTVFGAYGLEVFVASALIWIPLSVMLVLFLFSKKLNLPATKLRRFFILLSIGFTFSLLPTPLQIRHRVAFAEPFLWIFALIYIVERFSGDHPDGWFSKKLALIKRRR